jgi:hypothetical protein
MKVRLTEDRLSASAMWIALALATFAAALTAMGY